MADELQEYTVINIDDTVLRLEYIKLPNGNTYKVGLSLEEQQSFVDALSDLNDNIIAVNEDVEALKQENEDLKNEITELKELIKKQYMAYYDKDESKGIGENNTYSI